MDDPGVDISSSNIKKENDISMGEVNSSDKISEMSPQEQNNCEEELNSNEVNEQKSPESNLSEEELKRIKAVEEENKAFMVARELMYKNLYSDGEEGKSILSSNVPTKECENDEQFDSLSPSQYDKIFTDAKKAEEESLTWMHVLPGTDKPFCCTLCDYKSARKDKMKRHLLTHSVEKPLACPMCNYRCARRDKFKKHLQTHGLKDGYEQKRGLKRKLNSENDDNVENSAPSISDYHNYPISENITTPSIDMESHTDESTLKTNSIFDAFNKNSGLFDAHASLVPYIPPFLGKPQTPINKWQYKCSICSRKYKLEDSLIRHMEVHTGTTDSGVETSAYKLYNDIQNDKSNDCFKLPSQSMFSPGIKVETENENSVNDLAALNHGEINDPTKFLESSIEVKEESDSGVVNEGAIRGEDENEEPIDYSDDEIPSHIAEPMIVMDESDYEIPSHIAEPMVVMEEYDDDSNMLNSGFDHEARGSYHPGLYQSNMNIMNNVMGHVMEQAAMFSRMNTNPIQKWTNVCPICDRKYKLRDSLIGHMEVHKNDTNYLQIMQLINQPSANEVHIPQTNLGYHDLQMTEEKDVPNPNPRSFICTHCNYECTSMSKFVQHERTHTKEKPFGCTVCDKKFSRRDKLKDHMLRHTNEKPFACSECDFRCKRAEALKNHMQTHVGPQSSNNVESLKEVGSYNNLEHLSLSGEAIRKKSSSPKIKNAESPHLEGDTPGKKWPWACHICERKYKFKRSLEEHMEVHKSNNIDDKAKSKTEVVISFICPVCHNGLQHRLALDVHMKTHPEERPFACGTCQYTAHQKGNLKRHLLKNHGRIIETEYKASIDTDYKAVPNDENTNETIKIEPNTSEEENKEKSVIDLENDTEYEAVTDKSSNATEIIESNTYTEEKENITNVPENDTDMEVIPHEENSNESEIIKSNYCLEEENKEKVIVNDLGNDSDYGAAPNEVNSNEIEKIEANNFIGEENKIKFLKTDVGNDSNIIDNLAEREKGNLKVQTNANQGALTLTDDVQSILQNLENCMAEESIE